MDYTFDSYHNNGVRFDSTTRIEDIQADFSKGDYVKILDNRKSPGEDAVISINSEDSLLDWNMSKAFSAQWKPQRQDGCGEVKSKEPWNPLEETDGFHVKSPSQKLEAILDPAYNARIGEKPSGISWYKDGKLMMQVAAEGSIQDTSKNPCLEVPFPEGYLSPKDAINPSHYQAYIETENEVLQWLETMQYLPRFRNPESFKAAVELQGRKYFDRNGGKDAELQELQKGLWYFKFLVAYIKNGDKTIRVKDIDTILNRK